MYSKRITLFSLIGICLIFFATSVQAKTLVYCAEAAPAYFSGALAGSLTDRDFTTQVFDRLVEFEPGSTKIISGLAESWNISPNGLTYTFNLRKGVKFHSTKDFKPTRDFNADDVVFTFNRQLKKDHPYHDVSGGAYIGFESIGLNKVLKEVKKIDDYTVQFTLKDREAPFLTDLAITGFGSIVSAEFADEMMKAGTPEKIDQVPIGTGPFIFTDYQKDSLIRFKANPNYWRGKPKIENLVFSITTDPGIRLAKLEKGECHVIPYPNLSEIKTLRQNPDLVLLERGGTNMGFLAINTSKKPLNDVRVRKALTMAINKPAILEAVFHNYGTVGINPLPPVLLGYNKDIKDYPYDPEKAKKLLADAGYPDGFEIDLWALPVQRPYNPNGKRTAELIQADWEKIGVKTKIITYDWGEYIKRGQAGEHEAYMIGWQVQNGDPDNVLYTLFSCDGIEAKRNFTFWCNTAFDDLVISAKKTNDTDTRTKLYKQAQALFHEHLPAIILAYSKNIRPIRKEIKNYKQHPLGNNYFYDVDIEESK